MQPHVDRRSVLGKAALAAPLVAAGAALSPLTGLVSSAAAAEEPSDFELAAFLQTIELTAADLYELAGSKLADDVKATIGGFGEAHTGHAALFEDILSQAGETPPGAANSALTAAYSPRIADATDSDAVLEVLLDLENALAATYFHALGSVENGAEAAVIATILPVDAQHAVVIGTALKRPADQLVPEVQTDAGRLDPATYPVPVAAEDSGAATDSGSASTDSASS